jgi:PAS domain S-box-containing protein
MYDLVAKTMSRMARQVSMIIRNRGFNHLEILAVPKKGSSDKPFQCENRMGILEAVARLGTDGFARVEHPQCMHKGGPHCRYIVTWNPSTVRLWKRIRWITVAAAICTAVAAALLLESSAWTATLSMLFLSLSGVIMYTCRQERKLLLRTIDAQSASAKSFMEQSSSQYGNALLIQEVGRAASAFMGVGELCGRVMEIMKEHMDFDRGIVMVADEQARELVITGSFGFRPQEENRIRGARVPLQGQPESLFARIFSEGTPSVGYDLSRLEGIPDGEKTLMQDLSIRSCICVPIVYADRSLGILGVANVTDKRSSTQSDLNLLTGIASQLAVSIMNSRAYRKVQESEQRYRLLAENAHDVIWLTDLDFRYTYISPSVMRLRGYTPEEAMTLSLEQIYTPDSWGKAMELYREEYEAFWQRDRANRRVTRTVELEQIRKDGSTVWTEVTAGVLLDEEGEPVGLLGITRDISERKRAEEEKRQLQEKLIHAQKMEAVGTLAGGIAHDFNNILMGIQGNASLLLMSPDLGDAQRKRLEHVEQYVQRGSDLTRRLLGFARGGKYEVKATDVGDLVKKSLDMFGRTHKEIAIHSMLQTDLWSAEVDRGQIDQVLLNLFVNAFQAMPDGGDLYVRTENVTLDESFVGPYHAVPGRYVMVSVRDTGLGIDEKIRDRIFDPFFTTKGTGVNTGLGLASAYGIISNHGGIITCSSAMGKGSTFTFYLPAVARAPQKEHHPRTGIQTGTETILLVDDEDMILSVGKDLLQSLGYRVIVARGGMEAIRLYRTHAPEIDLVILDMIMPGMGGRETFEGIREIDPEARVLLASGYDMHGQALHLMERGCSGFIQKPFSMQDLSRKIREVLTGEDVCAPQYLA